MITKCVKMVVLFAVLAVSVATACAQAEPPEAKKYTAYAEDSLQLSVWVTTSTADTTAPILMLLPMMGHTHESYDMMVELLKGHSANSTDDACAQRPPHVVSFDLRGHGESIVRKSDTVSSRDMGEGEFARYPADVMTALESVWAQVGKDESGFYVVGASIGANAAMMLTEHLPVISKAVLLSPGLDYRGLRPAEALRKFEGDILIFACEDDQYSAESSRKLAAMNEEHCTLHIFKGSDHGTDIINGNFDAMLILVEFLCAPR